MERAVRFVVGFLCHPDGLDDVKVELAEEVLRFLTARSMALNKTVRFRTCQLIAGVLNSFAGEAELDAGLLDAVAQAMTMRLKDREPQVRALATRALARLQDPGARGDFSEDPVTSAFVGMLGSERVKLVRKHLLASIAISDHTLPSVVKHTRDAADDVRAVAFKVLGSKVPMENLSIGQRATIMRRGLEERSQAVRAAAVAVMNQWLCQCNGDALVLLQAMDVETNERVAELMLSELIAGGTLDTAELAERARAEESGLRRARGAPPLGPEEALLWRVAVEALHREADSRGRAAATTMGAEARHELARAEVSHDALEAALPETTGEFVELLRRHAAGGSRHGFATRQMVLLLARCLDFTDISSRSAAGDVLKKLLRKQPESVRGGGEVETAALRGDGGDGRWEAALGEAAVKVYDRDTAFELFSTAKDLVRDWEICAHARPESWVQCLAIVSIPLQCARTRASIEGGSCREVLDELVLPGVQHGAVAVRREAVKAIGLLCLLEHPDALVHARILRAAFEADEPQVRSAAAQCLLDFALLRGPGIVDSYCLAPPTESPQGDPEGLTFTRPLLEALESCLDRGGMPADNTPELLGTDQDRPRSVVAEGLAKLMMHAHLLPPACDFEEEDRKRVLAKLLLAYADPSAGVCPYLRQCLAVFFDAYVSFGAAHHKLLASSVLPALRAAVLTGQRKSFQSLGAYASRLLRTPLRAAGANGDGPVAVEHCDLAIQMAAEVQHCKETAASKQYIAVLCKMIACIPLEGAGGAKLRLLRGVVLRIAPHVSAKASAKDLTAALEHATRLEEDPEEPFTDRELEAIRSVDELVRNDDTLKAIELPFGGNGAASGRGERPRSAASATGSGSAKWRCRRSRCWRRGTRGGDSTGRTTAPSTPTAASSSPTRTGAWSWPTRPRRKSSTSTACTGWTRRRTPPPPRSGSCSRGSRCPTGSASRRRATCCTSRTPVGRSAATSSAAGRRSSRRSTSRGCWPGARGRRSRCGRRRRAATAFA